jgi:hypothetical protein
LDVESRYIDSTSKAFCYVLARQKLTLR